MWKHGEMNRYRKRAALLLAGAITVCGAAGISAAEEEYFVGKALAGLGSEEGQAVRTDRTAEAAQEEPDIIVDEAPDIIVSEDPAGIVTDPGQDTAEAEPDAVTETPDGDWCLILVNRTHPIPGNYEVTLMDLSNGCRVDERIYPALQAMFDAARADGLSLFVRDGYRTREDQQAIMDNKILEYESSGYSTEEATQLAEEWVALPGTSEHQLGISVDINADNSGSSDDAVYNWLYDNAWKYGFIKRYPEDKTDITGVINEPWHYRYVGEQAAQEIAMSGLCLEEYLGEA